MYSHQDGWRYSPEEEEPHYLKFTKQDKARYKRLQKEREEIEHWGTEEPLY